MSEAWASLPEIAAALEEIRQALLTLPPPPEGFDLELPSLPVLPEFFFL
jgi:hypothetical protein